MIAALTRAVPAGSLLSIVGMPCSPRTRGVQMTTSPLPSGCLPSTTECVFGFMSKLN